MIEVTEPALVSAGVAADRDPHGLEARFDINFGARGEGLVGSPSEHIEVSVPAAVVGNDVSRSLPNILREGIAAFEPYFAFIGLRDVIAPHNRDIGPFFKPTVGWMTYLDKTEFPEVPVDLDGMLVEDFSAGTMIQLTSRPWDPDNNRVTADIARAYDTLDEAGVLVPPKYIRDRIAQANGGDVESERGK